MPLRRELEDFPKKFIPLNEFKPFMTKGRPVALKNPGGGKSERLGQAFNIDPETGNVIEALPGMKVMEFSDGLVVGPATEEQFKMFFGEAIPAPISSKDINISEPDLSAEQILRESVNRRARPSGPLPSELQRTPEFIPKSRAIDVDTKGVKAPKPDLSTILEDLSRESQLAVTPEGDLPPTSAVTKLQSGDVKGSLDLARASAAIADLADPARFRRDLEPEAFLHDLIQGIPSGNLPLAERSPAFRGDTRSAEDLKAVERSNKLADLQALLGVKKFETGLEETRFNNDRLIQEARFRFQNMMDTVNTQRYQIQNNLDQQEVKNINDALRLKLSQIVGFGKLVELSDDPDTRKSAQDALNNIASEMFKPKAGSGSAVDTLRKAQENRKK